MVICKMGHFSSVGACRGGELKTAVVRILTTVPGACLLQWVVHCLCTLYMVPVSSEMTEDYTAFS